MVRCWAVITEYVTGFVVTLLVLLALCVSFLRFMFAHLDVYTDDLVNWVNTRTAYTLTLNDMKGRWHSLSPFLQIEGVSVVDTATQSSLLSVNQATIQFDILDSLLSGSPVFSLLVIDELSIDLSTLSSSSSSIDLKKQINHLLHFNSGVVAVNQAEIYLNKRKGLPTLNVSAFEWVSAAHDHQFQLKLVDPFEAENQLSVQGQLTDKDGISSLDGGVFFKAEDFSFAPWILSYLNPTVKLEKARLGMTAYIAFKEGKQITATADIENTHLTWSPLITDGEKEKQKHPHQIRLASGRLQATLDSEKINIISEALQIQSDELDWIPLKVKASANKSDWRVNLDQLRISSLMPLLDLMPLSSDVLDMRDGLNPDGIIRDVRFAISPDHPPYYAFTVDKLSTAHWSNFPALTHPSIDVQAMGGNGRVLVTAENERLEYGEFFQAPLELEKGRFSLYWQSQQTGLRLWSDDIDLQTAYLSLKGQFSLALPENAPAHLAFYGEADLTEIGETWRYLPTLALGKPLTDYLSNALQAGEVKGAQLLWDGQLNDFPYVNHQGVFQASMPVTQTKFEFDAAWPPLHDLDGHFLFENDGLTFSANSVALMEAEKTKITGSIPRFSANPAILELTGQVEGSGPAIRDYLLMTPLQESVGEGIAYVNPQGKIKGEIALTLPLDGSDGRVTGSATLNNNQLRMESLGLLLSNVSGNVVFDNDQFSAKALKADLLGQPIQLSVKGGLDAADYRVDIDAEGKWLAENIPTPFFQANEDRINGKIHWQLNGQLALKEDDTYVYLFDADAGLNHLFVDFPAPFTSTAFRDKQAKLQIKGDQSQFKGELSLPQLQYHLDGTLSKGAAKIVKSHLWIGKKADKAYPEYLSGNNVSIDVTDLDFSSWKTIWEEYSALPTSAPEKTSLQVPPLSRFNLQTEKLHLAGVELNNLSVSARQQNHQYHFIVGSEEISGNATLHNDRLTVVLEHLFINLNENEIPANDSQSNKSIKNEQKVASFFKAIEAPKATDVEKKIYQSLPSVDLSIDDIWLQGYRLGQLNAQLLKTDDAMVLSKFTIHSGKTQISADGRWTIDDEKQQTSQLSFKVSGENSADLMGRFAVTGGIQNASFNTNGSLQFHGAPWSLHRASLNGSVGIHFKNGYISGVGGMGRLLGLFSFDSILRKIRLDFSGVFEDGLVFDVIKGEAKITNGIVQTDNLMMKALAGKMNIKGYASLIDNQINADAKFIPDITSGLPVLTAFAATPHTALYVLAVTTVISPVVDAITQINYRVSGSLDSPLVEEVSRDKSQVTLPEKMLERLRVEQKKETTP